MQIVAALYIDDITMRQVPGPATRIDLVGVQFSAAAPQPAPFTWAVHMAVLISCAPDEAGTGALEVVFERDGEQIARNVQPLQVEPGKFSRQLIRPEVQLDDYGRIDAHVRIDMGPIVTVPFTVLPPVED